MIVYKGCKLWLNGRLNRSTGHRGVHVWRNRSGRVIHRIAFTLHDDESGAAYPVWIHCGAWVSKAEAVAAALTIQGQADRGMIDGVDDLRKLVRQARGWLARRNSQNKHDDRENRH